MEGEGLELTYKRSSKREGALDASIKTISLTDLAPSTTFGRIVAPGVTCTLSHVNGYLPFVEHHYVTARFLSNPIHPSLVAEKLCVVGEATVEGRKRLDTSVDLRLSPVTEGIVARHP